jgi:hypothetical protein
LRADGPQDHRRYLWRRGAAWRRRVFRQGPDKGRPLGCLCGALSREECRRRRSRRSLHDPGAYAIGVAKPLSVYVDLGGTGQVDEAKLSRVLQELMDLSPRGIRTHLGLNKPIYARTAAYGHFGRAPDPDGGFSWERLDLVPELRRAF